MSEPRFAVMEAWRDEHTREHEILWKKHDELAEKVQKTQIGQATLETRLAIYTALGVGVGSILGSVIGAVLVHFFTLGAKP